MNKMKRTFQWLRNGLACMTLAAPGAHQAAGLNVGQSETAKQKLLRSLAEHNPIVPDLTDIQPWSFYDRLQTAAAATSLSEYQFFTVPQSSTKPKNFTNMKQSQRLPDPKHFFVLAVRVYTRPNQLFNDLDALFSNYWLELYIGDKIYAEGTLPMYPAAAGLYGVSTETNRFAWTNGTSNINDVNNYGTDRGIHILQGQTFMCNVRTSTPFVVNAAGPGLDFMVFLDGILYREAQ